MGGVRAYLERMGADNIKVTGGSGVWFFSGVGGVEAWHLERAEAANAEVFSSGFPACGLWFGELEVLESGSRASFSDCVGPGCFSGLFSCRMQVCTTDNCNQNLDLRRTHNPRYGRVERKDL